MLSEIGPTGEFPDGKAYAEDKGRLAIVLGIDPIKELIVIEFGKPVTSLGFRPEEAILIADDLINKANMIIEAKNVHPFDSPTGR